MQYKVISVDDHVSEGARTWVDRVPAAMRDIVPQVKEVDGVSYWFVKGKQTPRLGPVKDRTELESRRAKALFQTRPGDWDPSERLKDYDLDGVDAGVLFPNYSGFSGDPCSWVRDDKKVQYECVKAYNDWMVDEFSATDRKRLIPLSLIPTWDGELAVAEAERTIKKGVAGVMFGAAPDIFGYPPLWNRVWEPFYSAVEEAGVPLVFHQPSAVTDRAVFTEKKYEIPTYIQSALAAEHLHSLILPVTEFLFSGILERHPRLRVLWAEGGASWVGYTLEQCNWVFGSRSRYDKNELRMLPSDYYQRQCVAGFLNDTIYPELMEFMGEDNMAWEADYLHSVTTFPGSRRVIQNSLRYIKDDRLRHKIVAGNTMKLFGMKDG